MHHRHMYEREAYAICGKLIQGSMLEGGSLAHASVMDLFGLIELDVNQPKSALVRFEEALFIRRDINNSEEDLLTASSYNNIGIALMESGQLLQSLEMHNKALELQKSLGSDRIGTSLSNLASLYLRMGNVSLAEQTLRSFPELLSLTDDTALAEYCLSTKDPRWVGNIVLLSRIRRQQGRISEAWFLADKALKFRLQAHGYLSYKTCDSLIDVATLPILRTEN